MPLHRYTASEYTDMILIYGECQQNAEAALKKYRERYGATRTCPGSVSVILQALQKLRENQPLESHQESDVSEDLVEPKEEQLDTAPRKRGRPPQVRDQAITQVKEKAAQQSSEPIKAQMLTCPGSVNVMKQVLQERRENHQPLESHQESDVSEDLVEPKEEQLDTPPRKRGRPPQGGDKAITKVKQKSAQESSESIKAQMLTCPGSVNVMEQALQELLENQPLESHQESDISEDLVEPKEEQLDTPPRKRGRPPPRKRGRPPQGGDKAITKVKKKSAQVSSESIKAQMLTCPGSVNVMEQALPELLEIQHLESHQESDVSEDSVEPSEEQLDTPPRKKRRPPKIRNKTARQYSRPSKAQTLTSNNPTRESFCRWVLSKVSQNHDFLFNMMWTGESTFTVNNIQHPANRFYWGREPPIEWPEFPAPIPLHVWAAIHRNEIIGPIFIDGNLNATKFLDILSGPVTEYMDELTIDVRKRLWVQLNGLPAHSAPPVRERLTEMFGEQWIGRYGPHKWPAKSADLSPLELFLWEYIKREAYAKKTKNCIEELKKRIIAAFDKLKKLVAKSDLLTRERNKVLKRYEISIAGIKKGKK